MRRTLHISFEPNFNISRPTMDGSGPELAKTDLEINRDSVHYAGHKVGLSQSIRTWHAGGNSYCCSPDMAGLMNLRDTDTPQTIDYCNDPDDPHNYLPKTGGGFGIGLLAGILLGMPFEFYGASAGALVGSLLGVFADQELHALNVARERCRICWKGRDDW